MAKKLVKQVKLQIEAAKATPAPPVGPALGQAGVNIVAFTKEFNERTAKQAGLIIPVVINVSICWRKSPIIESSDMGFCLW